MRNRRQIILFTTGSQTDKLKRLELTFNLHLGLYAPVKIIHLGNVDNLSQSYHHAAKNIENPEALLIFCHQDAYPFLDNQGSEPPWKIPSWLRVAFDNPSSWIDAAEQLFTRTDTGLLGVAGARGLLSEIPWWQYPEVSGAVMHQSPSGEMRLNTYGRYGRTAVLDGLCLMVLRRTYDLLANPAASLTGFHFYDIDLSLRAHLAGLKNWTVPLLLLHESPGASSDDIAWNRDQQHFLESYKHLLPLHVPYESLPESFW